MGRVEDELPPGPLGRVLRQAGGRPVFDVLASGLPGADLSTLLMAVVRARSGALAPKDVLRRYRQDRAARTPLRSCGGLGSREELMSTSPSRPPGTRDR
jgi:hypothetical protein